MWKLYNLNINEYHGISNYLMIWWGNIFCHREYKSSYTYSRWGDEEARRHRLFFLATNCQSVWEYIYCCVRNFGQDYSSSNGYSDSKIWRWCMISVKTKEETRHNFILNQIFSPSQLNTLMTNSGHKTLESKHTVLVEVNGAKLCIFNI